MSNRQKSGLHKEISSIFNGVPLPSDKANGPLPDMEKKDKSAGHIPPVPTGDVKGPQISQQEPSKEAPPAKDKAIPARKKTGFARKEKTASVQVAKKMRGNDFRSSLKKSLKPMINKLMTPPEGVSQKKHMTTLALIPILILVVIFVFGRVLLKSGPSNDNSNQDDTGVTSVAPKTKIDWQMPEVYPEGLRDPMNKAYKHSIDTDTDNTEDLGIVIRGIAWSEDNPAVIIETEIYYQGQKVHGAEIKKITFDSVEFEKDGKTWTQNVSNLP